MNKIHIDDIERTICGFKDGEVFDRSGCLYGTILDDDQVKALTAEQLLDAIHQCDLDLVVVVRNDDEFELIDPTADCYRLSSGRAPDRD